MRSSSMATPARSGFEGRQRASWLSRRQFPTQPLRMGCARQPVLAGKRKHPVHRGVDRPTAACQRGQQDLHRGRACRLDGCQQGTGWPGFTRRSPPIRLYPLVPTAAGVAPGTCARSVLSTTLRPPVSTSRTNVVRLIRNQLAEEQLVSIFRARRPWKNGSKDIESHVATLAHDHQGHRTQVGFRSPDAQGR